MLVFFHLSFFMDMMLWNIHYMLLLSLQPQPKDSDQGISSLGNNLSTLVIS